MKLLIALVLLGKASSCLACYVPPPEQHTPPDELIARTSNIVLAEVVKGETSANGVVYTFRKIRSLAGKSREVFELVGFPAIWEGNNRTFDNHFDEDFWKNRAGRVVYGTDCRLRLNFSVGGTYLLFLDPPYHSKGFELIIRTHGEADIQDKWLQYVADRVGPNYAIKPIAE